MRPAVVVEALEPGQLDVQRARAQLAGAGLAELVAAGRVGALDAAAAIRAFGRQREQFYAAATAGGLEPGHELLAREAGLDGEAVLARQHVADLVAPPQRKALPRLAHQLELGGGPLVLPHPVRAAAPVGQGADALLAPSRRSWSNSASLSKRSYRSMKVAPKPASQALPIAVESLI